MRKIHLVIFLWLLAPLLARAGGEEVVIVYNRNSPDSKAVAAYYARMRHVPKNQIFGFSLPTTENISRKDFLELLQIPLAQKLEGSGLWTFGDRMLPPSHGFPARPVRCIVASKIRYAVLCYNVPLKI